MHSLPPDLVRTYTTQLYKEYDNLLFQRRVTLSRPVIEIRDIGQKWGEWNSHIRVIRLHLRLIREHSWDVVLEVLKHEVAHQFVSESQPEGRTERPHGEKFAHACATFGVADWAKAACGDLPTHIPGWKDRVLSEPEEKLFKKVEKLLALAGSTNEHEACSAMARVREMYAKYHLNEAKRGASSEHAYVHLGLKRKRIPRTDSVICSILTEFFFVKVIHLDLYDSEDLCEYKTTEVMGTCPNLLMAEYVYVFLVQQLESLWNNFRLETGTPARSRNAYQLGVLNGFRDKLKSERSLETLGNDLGFQASDSKALVKVIEDATESYYHSRYPRVSNRRWNTLRADPRCYHAGKEEGRRLTLNRPVEKSGGFGGFLRQ